MKEFDTELLVVEQEAKRLLEKISEYKSCKSYSRNNDGYSYYHSPERASVKRASMDLTKELSKLRKTKVY